jgi:predicted RecA/RadA family phage recombinase
MSTGIIADSIQNARTLTVAHGAAVAAYDVVVNNGNVLIALQPALISTLNSYMYMGKVTLPKATPLVINPGDKVYWDVADGNLNKSASGNTPAGICVELAGSADTEVTIFLFPNVGALPTSLETSTHYVFAAGVFTTVGGDANETITVANLLSTDVVVASLAQKGASPVTILTAIAAAGQINVVMSNDPSTDHKIAYHVLRAV